VCPLRLLRATSMVRSENLSIALSRYDFIRGFMRWCDVIFLRARLNCLLWNPTRLGVHNFIRKGHTPSHTRGQSPSQRVPGCNRSLGCRVLLVNSDIPERGLPKSSWSNRELAFEGIYFPCRFSFWTSYSSPSGSFLRFGNLDAFCLPILRRKKGGYEGLILKPAARGDGYYERVGTFAHPNPPVMKMLESAPQVSFILTQN
jgi:hypothetical protein